MIFDLLELVKERFREIKCLVFSSSENPTIIARASLAGVDEYVFKSTPLAGLFDVATYLCLDGPPVFAQRMRPVISKLRVNSAANSIQSVLTKRELQITRHLAYGLSNKEIAASLGVSIETVKEHLQNILRKTTLKDRTQVAVWAVRNRLV